MTNRNRVEVETILHCMKAGEARRFSMNRPESDARTSQHPAFIVFRLVVA
ncbi:hypothetical protein BH23CHL5_BH23CHL5_13910 [soil metagenome]